MKDLIIGTVQDGVNSGLDFSSMVNADGTAADSDVADVLFQVFSGICNGKHCDEGGR